MEQEALARVLAEDLWGDDWEHTSPVLQKNALRAAEIVLCAGYHHTAELEARLFQLERSIIEHRVEVSRLREAVRVHRDAPGHMRGWMDDRRLYLVLPEAVPTQEGMPPLPEYMRRCAEYWESHATR